MKEIEREIIVQGFQEKRRKNERTKEEGKKKDKDICMMIKYHYGMRLECFCYSKIIF